MTSYPIIEPSKILVQVAKIVKTDQFRSSRILSNFLQYVVKETLDGNERSLKEYVIATEVLKKSPDFNPQLDAVVRIHARRLRQELVRYYSGAGKEDPIRIDIPKGRYIPVFEKNLSSSASGVEDDKIESLNIKSIPTVAVFPFDCMGANKRGGVICSLLTRDISIGLSAFKELKVISTHSTEYVKENLKNWNDMVSHLGTDYIITGNCLREKGNLKVSVELHHCKDDQVIWAESMVIEDFEQDEIASYKKVVKRVVSKACGFLGMIYQVQLNQEIPQDYSTLYAIYWHNRYHRQFTPDAFNETSIAVDKALSINPDNALLTAFKAEIMLNLSAMDVEGADEYYTQGSLLITRALDLDKNSQHAWQVFAWNKLLEKNAPDYNRAAEKCLAINPYNAAYIGSIGFGHECAGRYEEGLDLMLESIDMNPFYPWQTNVGLCFYYLHKQEFEEANYWAEMINRPGSLWDAVLRVATLGLLNRREDAGPAITNLKEASPKIKERATIIVGRFIFDQDLQAQILKGLHQAGIDFLPSS